MKFYQKSLLAKRPQIAHICKIVLQNIIFLSRQGLPLRGNWVPSADGDGGCEFDSNFHQLMLLRGKDDPNILDVMKRKTCKYTDHHIQDELMKIVACNHLSKIGDSTRDAGYFTLEADEVTDSSNKEQLIICLRWVVNHFDPHEESSYAYVTLMIPLLIQLSIISKTLSFV